MKKKSPWLVIAAAIILGVLAKLDVNNADTKISAGNDQGRIEQAFQRRQSDVQVRGSGKVIKLLADDLKGSRHQRFLIRLRSGQTVLVAHNIDLAPRVKNLRKGDAIEFYGEYEWNEKGGVLHWTHRDPGGRHVDGWLRYNGKTYQ